MQSWHGIIKIHCFLDNKLAFHNFSLKANIERYSRQKKQFLRFLEQKCSLNMELMLNSYQCKPRTYINVLNISQWCNILSCIAKPWSFCAENIKSGSERPVWLVMRFSCNVFVQVLMMRKFDQYICEASDTCFSFLVKSKEIHNHWSKRSTIHAIFTFYLVDKISILLTSIKDSNWIGVFSVLKLLSHLHGNGWIPGSSLTDNTLSFKF